MTTITETNPVAQTLRRPGHRTIRTPIFDLRFNTRVLRIIVGALVLTSVVAIWNMALGEVSLSFREVLSAVLGNGTERSEFVVRELRAPRTVLAILVGAALAMSGAIFQGLVRNELVSPDIIGINTGAAGVGFVWLLYTRNVTALPIVLFLGAIGCAFLIYVLSWKGGVAPNRLILVGIGFATLFSAVEAFLVRRFPLEDIIWVDNLLLGSVAHATWGDVSVMGIGMSVAMPVVLLLAGPLRALQLGDETAKTIGIPVELLRLGLVIAACLLAALAVSVSGLIGFVALMVPHIARMLAGPISGSVLLLTATIGGFLVLTADMVGNNLLPVSLPVSIVMGAIGAPYFLFLFWRTGVRL